MRLSLVLLLLAAVPILATSYGFKVEASSGEVEVKLESSLYSAYDNLRGSLYMAEPCGGNYTVYFSESVEETVTVHFDDSCITSVTAKSSAENYTYLAYLILLRISQYSYDRELASNNTWLSYGSAKGLALRLSGYCPEGGGIISRYFEGEYYKVYPYDVEEGGVYAAYFYWLSERYSVRDVMYKVFKYRELGWVYEKYVEFLLSLVDGMEFCGSRYYPGFESAEDGEYPSLYFNGLTAKYWRVHVGRNKVLVVIHDNKTLSTAYNDTCIVPEEEYFKLALVNPRLSIIRSRVVVEIKDFDITVDLKNLIADLVNGALSFEVNASFCNRRVRIRDYTINGSRTNIVSIGSWGVYKLVFRYKNGTVDYTRVFTVSLREPVVEFVRAPAGGGSWGWIAVRIKPPDGLNATVRAPVTLYGTGVVVNKVDKPIITLEPGGGWQKVVVWFNLTKYFDGNVAFRIGGVDFGRAFELVIPEVDVISASGDLIRAEVRVKGEIRDVKCRIPCKEIISIKRGDWYEVFIPVEISGLNVEAELNATISDVIFNRGLMRVRACALLKSSGAEVVNMTVALNDTVVLDKQMRVGDSVCDFVVVKIPRDNLTLALSDNFGNSAYVDVKYLVRDTRASLERPVEIIHANFSSPTFLLLKLGPGVIARTYVEEGVRSNASERGSIARRVLLFFPPGPRSARIEISPIRLNLEAYPLEYRVDNDVLYVEVRSRYPANQTVRINGGEYEMRSGELTLELENVGELARGGSVRLNSTYVNELGMSVVEYVEFEFKEPEVEADYDIIGFEKDGVRVNVTICVDSKLVNSSAEVFGRMLEAPKGKRSCTWEVFKRDRGLKISLGRHSFEIPVHTGREYAFCVRALGYAPGPIKEELVRRLKSAVLSGYYDDAVRLAKSVSYYSNTPLWDFVGALIKPKVDTRSVNKFVEGAEALFYTPIISTVTYAVVLLIAVHLAVRRIFRV